MADVRFEPGWEEQALEATRPACRALNKAILSDMLRLVPRDTGELADTGKAYTVSGHRYRCRFGTDHWAPNEYGTRHMSAQPFMRPAFLKKREL